MNNQQTINSKYVLDYISSSIVQVAKIIQVEKQCTVEESIEIVRQFLVKSQNELMNKDLNVNIQNKLTEVKSKISSGKATINDRWIYNTLKAIGII